MLGRAGWYGRGDASWFCPAWKQSGWIAGAYAELFANVNDLQRANSPYWRDPPSMSSSSSSSNNSETFAAPESISPPTVTMLNETSTSRYMHNYIIDGFHYCVGIVYYTNTKIPVFSDNHNKSLLINSHQWPMRNLRREETNED